MESCTALDVHHHYLHQCQSRRCSWKQLLKVACEDEDPSLFKKIYAHATQYNHSNIKTLNRRGQKRLQYATNICPKIKDRNVTV